MCIGKIRMIDNIGDKMTYVCTDCGKEFSDMPSNNECDMCGNLLHKKEEVKTPSVPKDPAIRGENGLGIIVMDFSGSMDELAFPNEPEYTKSKASVVASALKSSIVKIKRMNKADKAYVALIGFVGEAVLLDVFKASEIDDNIAYWDNWFNNKIDYVRNTIGGGTNITSALRLARGIYDGALAGDLSTYGINDFSPMYQNIAIGSDVYDVANVRVFVYSDGEHYADEKFVNYFEDASLIPGKTNVNGVTAAFLGNIADRGYKNMENIAGVCPNHGVKAVIHINQSKYYDYLRDLFHMTSSTSGFCVECAKQGKKISLGK
jgi:DNA-directed RNA polymerase subunit RPC12/RpoP